MNNYIIIIVFIIINIICIINIINFIIIMIIIIMMMIIITYKNFMELLQTILQMQHYINTTCEMYTFINNILI